jgi:hypothetical protein
VVNHRDMELNEEHKNFILNQVEELRKYLVSQGFSDEAISFMYVVTNCENRDEEDEEKIKYDFVSVISLADYMDSEPLLDAAEQQMLHIVGEAVEEEEIIDDIENFFEDKDTSSIDFLEKISKNN